MGYAKAWLFFDGKIWYWNICYKSGDHQKADGCQESVCYSPKRKVFQYGKNNKEANKKMGIYINFKDITRFVAAYLILFMMTNQRGVFSAVCRICGRVTCRGNGQKGQEKKQRSHKDESKSKIEKEGGGGGRL